MKRVLILLVVLVIYGSLSPWHFEARPLPDGPFAYLFSRWDLPNNPYLVHDIGVNMLLYVPLGFAAHFALTGADLLEPVFLALALSFSIEFAQIYEPGRLASMVDILANTSGAAIGVVLGVFVRAVRGWGKPRRINAAFAWLFLAGVAAFRLTPLRF